MTNVDLDKFRSEWRSELSNKSVAGSSKETDASLKSGEREDLPGSSADQAVRLYEQAVESEQVGQLGDSIIFYRRAFKLDDNVDKRYGRYMRHKVAREQEEANEINEDTGITPEKNDIELNKHGNYVYDFAKTIQVCGVFDGVELHLTALRPSQMHLNNRATGWML